MITLVVSGFCGYCFGRAITEVSWRLKWREISKMNGKQ